MMTVTYLRRPLRLRLAWRLQTIYLRWRLKHAERCHENHKRDLAHLREDVDRMETQLKWDAQYATELAQKIHRIESK